jgi:outer membrane immunogenic protein
MMNKKHLLAGAAVLAIAAATSANAADLAVKAPPPYVAPAAAYNWSGFYAGIVGGGGIYQQTSPAYYYNDGYNVTDQGHGFTVGGTLGWNAQSGNFVYGIEGDISWSNLKIAGHSNYSDYDYYSNRGSWDAFATLRGRMGLAVNSTLAYVTGGLAFVNVNQQFCYAGLSACGAYAGYYDFNNKTWQTGFAAGGGVEHAFTPNVTFKAEYLYIGLPNKSVTNQYTIDGGYTQPAFASSAHLFRVGLNYAFH